MKKPYVLKPYPNRFCTMYALDDSRIPKALFETEANRPDLKGFPYPLPSRKSDYTCFTVCDDGVVWYGAKTGLTRYDEKAENKYDKIMFFSADRDLPDNEVRALLKDKNNVWVLTKTGVTYIEMRMLTAEEKAGLLLEETLKYVDRRGMVSQKDLQIPRDLESICPYGHSDNDGCFTAGFAIGEIFHYAYLRDRKGEKDPETQKIRAVAVRACEACLLLMNISGRGNGFVARSYMTPDEPIPNDGIFYRKKGGTATCIETNSSRKRNIAGKVIDASSPVPERLAKLYTDLGYGDDGIVYKGDTSSDEITLHFLHLYFADKYLAPGDPELKELLKMTAANTMDHIIEHGYELWECDDEPTSWAKWSLRYFDDKSGLGWVDGCLNAAEVLMYHLVTMEITGEQGKWRESYEYLLDKGYADLTEMHYDRFWQATANDGMDYIEDLMFGDNALAVASFWVLCTVEKNEALLRKYRNGFKSWRSTLAEEYNPGYDFPFALACPDEEIDLERIAMWINRANVSRLAASVSLMGRQDVPKKIHKNGYTQTSYLVPPDERFISKYDRDPLQYRNEDSGGIHCVESCYVYTNAYWIGKYFGFFE